MNIVTCQVILFQIYQEFLVIITVTVTAAAVAINAALMDATGVMDAMDVTGAMGSQVLVVIQEQQVPLVQQDTKVTVEIVDQQAHKVLKAYKD